MNEINWIEIILTFLGGLGLFLFGMEFMGAGLQKAAGNKMKNLLGVLTTNRFLGVLVGAGVTALIQSSSATTIMVVGFVNAGLMSLKQAVGVIMGANVGTTVTAWIVSLGEWTKFLKPDVLAPIFIIIGVILIMFTKKPSVRHIGEILFGFGALFLGLDNMSAAAKPLRSLEEVKNLFVTLGSSPILGILVGALVTAIIQSSSASVGILQALALSGLVPWNSAIYIILGQNIGTCVTAILSSIHATPNAKRAATIHFLFNFIGSVLFGIIAIAIFTFAIPSLGTTNITVTEISIVHTIFNILNTIILFPFAGGLVYLAEHIIKDKETNESPLLQHLDERILETPSFAIENAIKEVDNMAQVARYNAVIALEALLEKNSQKVASVLEKEKTINTYQKGIGEYLVKLSNVPLSEKEHLTVTELFYMINDIERIGDHAENIAELTDSMLENNTNFSENAINDLKEIGNVAIEAFEKAMMAYTTRDVVLAEEAMALEDRVDKLEVARKEAHLIRLKKGSCNPIAGIVFVDLLSNIERIADHASNIALRIFSEEKLEEE